MKEPPIKPTHEWPESGFKVGVPADHESTKLPRLSRALSLLQILLWVMPTVFLASSSWGIGSYLPSGNASFLLWVVVNLAFLGITGWFNAIMSSRVRGMEPGKRTGMIIWLTAAFALLQLFLIPLISVFLIFAFCAFVPR